MNLDNDGNSITRPTVYKKLVDYSVRRASGPRLQGQDGEVNHHEHGHQHQHQQQGVGDTKLEEAALLIEARRAAVLESLRPVAPVDSTATFTKMPPPRRSSMGSKTATTCSTIGTRKNRRTSFNKSATIKASCVNTSSNGQDDDEGSIGVDQLQAQSTMPSTTSYSGAGKNYTSHSNSPFHDSISTLGSGLTSRGMMQQSNSIFQDSWNTLGRDSTCTVNPSPRGRTPSSRDRRKKMNWLANNAPRRNLKESLLLSSSSDRGANGTTTLVVPPPILKVIYPKGKEPPVSTTATAASRTGTTTPLTLEDNNHNINNQKLAGIPEEKAAVPPPVDTFTESDTDSESYRLFWERTTPARTMSLEDRRQYFVESTIVPSQSSSSRSSGTNSSNSDNQTSSSASSEDSAGAASESSSSLSNKTLAPINTNKNNNHNNDNKSWSLRTLSATKPVVANASRRRSSTSFVAGSQIRTINVVCKQV